MFGAGTIQLDEAKAIPVTLPQASSGAAPLAPYDPAMVQIFKSQLEAYKNQLIDMYTHRADLVADREATRFQYLTGFRFKLENCLANAKDKMIADGKQSLAQAFQTYFSTPLKAVIPMVNLNGTSIPAYKQSNNLFIISSMGFYPSPYPTYMSPIADLIDTVYTMTSGVAGKTVTDTFFHANKSGLINKPFPFSSDYMTSGFYYTDYALNKNLLFTIPPSLEFLKKALSWATPIAAGDDAYVSTLLTQNGFNEIMTDGSALLTKLVNQTQEIFNYQANIDDIEDQVQAFITQYKSYGLIDQSVSLNSIFQELTALSANENAKQVVEYNNAAAAAASNTEVTGVQTTAPVPVPAKKSYLNYYIGAAIIFLLLKRNKG